MLASTDHDGSCPVGPNNKYELVAAGRSASPRYHEWNNYAAKGNRQLGVHIEKIYDLETPLWLRGIDDLLLKIDANGVLKMETSNFHCFLIVLYPWSLLIIIKPILTSPLDNLPDEPR
jgi:hypothetical protein